MPKLSRLEARMEALTRQFVADIVATIRTASFAEVAGFLPGGASTWMPARQARQAPARPTPRRPRRAAPPASGRRPRQTADKRAELANRVLQALARTGSRMGVRAIASEIGVAADLLAVPLRELRAAGRIAKHGEKRATTYSAA